MLGDISSDIGWTCIIVYVFMARVACNVDLTISYCES